MSRTITNIILCFLILFALLFTIPTYFAEHPYYERFLNQVFPPFYLLWFLIIPFVITFGYLFYKKYKQNSNTVSLSIRPLTIIGSVLFGLVLLFNIYSLHPANNVFRTYTEELRDTQVRLLEQDRLPANIQEDQVALTRYLQSQRKSTWRTAEEVLPKEALWINHLGIVANIHFLLHALFITALLLIISLSSYNLGSILFHGLRFHRHAAFEEETQGPKTLLCIGLGIALWIILLLLLGSIQVLTTPIVWGVLLLTLFIYRSTWNFLRLLWTKTTHIVSLFSIQPVLYTILWLFVTMTAYQLFRPIPIGWDDMSVYMNIPHLISQSGTLVSGHSAYGWSLFMSLGFLLGQSTVLTMFLSWFGGLLVILGFLLYSKSLFSGRAGVIMATLFISLPMVLFQISQDMKIDMGLLFMGMSSLYVFLLWWKQTDQPDNTNFWKRFGLVLLAGVLLGSAFSIKYTAFLLLCVLWFLLGYRFFGWVSTLLSLGFLACITATTRFVDILGITLSSSWYYYIGLIGVITCTLSFVWILVRYRKTARTQLTVLLVFLIAVSLPILPWLAKHHLETKSWQVRPLLSGQYTYPTITTERINIPNEENIPEHTEVKETEVAPQVPRSSGVLVELGRYFGYDTGWFPYLSLPYVQTMNTHVQGEYIDISFLFFILVPFALVVISKGRHSTWWNSIFVIGFILITLLSFGTFGKDTSTWFSGSIFESLVHLLQQPIGTLAFTSIGVFLLGYLGILLYGFWHGSPWQSHHKILLLGAGLYWALWALLGSGVIWYGIFGFIPMLALIAYCDHYLRHSHTTLSYTYLLRFVVCLIVLFWFATSLSHKLFMIETPAFARYKAGVSADQTIEDLLPSYLETAEILNQNSEDFIYRAGTFLSYFIQENTSRVLIDNQLDQFHQYYVTVDQEQPEAFLERLRRSGIKYIILDLNISTIDQTEHLSLVADHKRFLEFITVVQPSLEIVGSKIQDTTLEQLQKQPPQIGTTLVFYTREGTIYTVYTGPQDLTPPTGTQRIGVGQGSGTFIAWKIN